MTLTEATLKANQLQYRIGKTIGSSTATGKLIIPAPTDKEELGKFLYRLAPPSYGVDYALSQVLSKDFDVIIIFDHPAPDVISKGWYRDYFPLPE